MTETQGLCYAEFDARAPWTDCLRLRPRDHWRVPHLCNRLESDSRIRHRYGEGGAGLAQLRRLGGWEEDSGSINSTMHMEISFFGDYPDFLGFAITSVPTARDSDSCRTVPINSLRPNYPAFTSHSTLSHGLTSANRPSEFLDDRSMHTSPNLYAGSENTPPSPKTDRD